ncbi:MAG TPA: ABC transporter ATP-binding protein [Candidatus Dormibacteraeota bacterium]|nr:ABC transporter ATP-binding protein [Candidatus Dormibacteraeota bacterium]
MQAPAPASTPGDDRSIVTRGLSKRYGTILAVDGLDLDVRDGEVYGLLGPNGAGKTTTLRMLLGLARPTAGTALVAGHPPGSAPSLASVGSLIEAPAFWPYLSGRDNLRALAAYVGASHERVEEVLADVELTGRASDRFHTYSLGMKQRLGVAAALLKKPNILVLDEPGSGLDPAGMIEMRELIGGLRKDRRTVLLSSHLLAEVEHLCDRVGVIQHGRLIAEGTPSELRGEGRLVLRAAPTDRARVVLAGLLGRDNVASEDGLFQLVVDPSRAAEINRRLVLEDVDVTELRIARRSLEDVFMQLTEEAP